MYVRPAGLHLQAYMNLFIWKVSTSVGTASTNVSYVIECGIPKEMLLGSDQIDRRWFS